MTSVTNQSAFEKGSLGIQAVLFIVTFSLYGIYWLYKVNSQLAAGTDAEFDPAVRTLITLIPLVGLYGLWQTSNDAEAVAGQSGGLLFVLFILLPPVSWFFVQSGINQVASEA